MIPVYLRENRSNEKFSCKIRLIDLLCLLECLQGTVSPVLGDIVIVASTIVTISSRQWLYHAFSRISGNNPARLRPVVKIGRFKCVDSFIY